MSDQPQGLLALLVLVIGAYFAGRGDGERVARADYQQAIDDAHARMDRIERGTP